MVDIKSTVSAMPLTGNVADYAMENVAVDSQADYHSMLSHRPSGTVFTYKQCRIYRGNFPKLAFSLMLLTEASRQSIMDSCILLSMTNELK